LAIASQLAGWPTATVNDATGSKYQYSSGDHSKPVLKLPGAVELIGQDPAPSNAETASGAAYRLNPRFSLWLQGYPDGWVSCGERGMRSYRKSRRRS
ncbi:hypothetical protein LCGC14_1030710, partial [marine sediment metagenome]